MARVGVIGSGVGGLSAAIRLAALGHSVSVFERNAVPGGKLASTTLDGFTFDTGPSLLTLPHIFDHLLRIAGGSLNQSLDITRLDTAFRYTFADGTYFTASDNRDDTEYSINELCGGGYEWRAFMKRSARAWEVAERTFLAGPIESPLALLERMKTPRDFFAIDPFKSLSTRAASSFTDVRMQQWVNRYATYSGSSPWKAPATLACIPHVEQEYGCWHVQGGIAALAATLTNAAQSLGVETHVGAEVTKVVTEAGAVTGLVVDGSTWECDVAIANCDAEHLYSELLPDPKSMKKAKRAGHSSSGFALLLGLRGQTAGAVHHNVWFSGDQQREFKQIFEGDGIADDPTIYVCNASATDQSAAPKGDESWFVLANVGAGSATDWKSYGDKIIKRLGIEERIQTSSMITPADIESRYRSPGGAIYGTSSNGARSAFMRASNRGPAKGLYLAGGSAHPGGGLPLVALSGAIVSEMVRRDLQ